MLFLLLSNHGSMRKVERFSHRDSRRNPAETVTDEKQILIDAQSIAALPICQDSCAHNVNICKYCVEQGERLIMLGTFAHLAAAC